MGRDSSVGTATHYGLGGPGIESRWGRDFLDPSRPELGPIQSPAKWVPGLRTGVEGWLIAPSVEIKERVECSPSEPSRPDLEWLYFVFLYCRWYIGHRFSKRDTSISLPHGFSIVSFSLGPSGNPLSIFRLKSDLIFNSSKIISNLVSSLLLLLHSLKLCLIICLG